MIAQIDEAHAALITGHVGPAGEGDSLANQGLIDQAAEVGTHGGKAPLENAGPRWGRKAPYSAAEAPAGANPPLPRAGPVGPPGRAGRPYTPF